MGSFSLAHAEEKFKLSSFYMQKVLAFIEIYQAWKYKTTCSFFSHNLEAKWIKIFLRSFFRFMLSALSQGIGVNRNLHSVAIFFPSRTWSNLICKFCRNNFVFSFSSQWKISVGLGWHHHFTFTGKLNRVFFSFNPFCSENNVLVKPEVNSHVTAGGVITCQLRWCHVTKSFDRRK